MKYLSTHHRAPAASLAEAVARGLAPDGGLYMPAHIKRLPPYWFAAMEHMADVDIAFHVAQALLGDDVPAEALHRIVADAFNFDLPVVRLASRVSVLELNHGPTLAFKDVGARFMARLVCYLDRGAGSGAPLNVLVATSGDTGSAVAAGFLNLPNVHVFVLYPRGRVSALQERQFATLGHNITALAVEGSFDDCQALVKQAFGDAALRHAMRLTSANSINVARFLPQSIYYFTAYAHLRRAGVRSPLVVSVPSGNLGNLAAGVLARQMGLPIARFVAACNANDVVPRYLSGEKFEPRPSRPTLANAMDVGNPSNLERIVWLYGGDEAALRADVTGCVTTDAQIERTLRNLYHSTGYLLCPHGACALNALLHTLRPGEHGLMLATAHPAKFRSSVERITGHGVALPSALAQRASQPLLIRRLEARFEAFKQFLLAHAALAGQQAV